MSTAKRGEDKKRRREKRLAKRDRLADDLGALAKLLERVSKVPTPQSFPGGCDPTLARPDTLKFEYSQWLTQKSGRERIRRFEQSIEQGLLSGFPDVDHWAMEEFFWHGDPNDAWQPIDAFLAAHSQRVPPPAQEQLQRWKQAKLGLWELGGCADDLVEIRERDSLTGQPLGRWVGAIGLNLGGVNAYAQQKGKIALSYVSPWAPAEDIYCLMGYGLCPQPEEMALAAQLIQGFRSMKAVTFPLPWKKGVMALKECAEQWRRRDWHAWMKEQVHCPFQAAVPLPKKGPQILTIDALVTRSAAEAARMGIYFSALIGEEEAGLLGASGITPLDVDSPNALAFAEYQAYRDLVGAPPVTRGM